MHGKKILKLIHKIFSWLPLATVIDHKVLVVHGGISDTTDLDTIVKVDRHKYVSVLRPPMPRKDSAHNKPHVSNGRTKYAFEQDVGRKRVYSLTYSRPKPSQRQDIQRRSLDNLPRNAQCNWSVDEQLQWRRRQAGFDLSYEEPDSDSDPEVTETDENQWKQVVDILWSDPMSQNGCTPNEVRGGGCYWGPDVTEEVLSRHKLHLLIRSHECKQEGYEFCHNHKVLTIFSASNYYDLGSNRGAYVRMGPDLVPHFNQYQASRTCRELTLRQSVGQTEKSALNALKEQLFAHKSHLISAFQDCDTNKTGIISLSQWASATESILNLGLPWRVLRPQLITCTQDGMVDYQEWIKEFSITGPKHEVRNNQHYDIVSHRQKKYNSFQISDTSILETMYKNHSNLETIFRIIDTDHSGLISYEEFLQTWKLLSSHLKLEISDKAISDLAQSIDFNKDGSIDINEFMEAFRLVDLSSLQQRDII